LKLGSGEGLLARTEVERLRLSVALLVERRAGLYLVADGFVLFGILVGVLAGEDPAQFYLAVLAPCILLGVPILGDAVALERRAGSLDLALSSPGAGFYFEWRVGLFCGVMAVQCGFLLAVIRVGVAPFAVAPALVQSCLSCALIGAAALFWSTHLRGAGAIAFATYLTLAGLGPWLLGNPIYTLPMRLDDVVDWFKANVVLALTAIVLYLYARRRLARPERILS
jgi:hypothetical protein